MLVLLQWLFRINIWRQWKEQIELVVFRVKFYGLQFVKFFLLESLAIIVTGKGVFKELIISFFCDGVLSLYQLNKIIISIFILFLKLRYY